MNEKGGLIIDEKGNIEAIGKKVNKSNIPTNANIIDAKERYLFPGIIDMRVFVGEPGFRTEVWSYGHRNPQGAALHPKTGRLWIHEHGAMGGDEINIPLPGRNYGWPVIAYGRHYSGNKIGVGTHKKGMEQPIYYWDPSIAPSGMVFYTGDAFLKWRGNLFVGSLKFRLLVRLTLKGDMVVKEEHLLKDFGERIRDVRQGPDGLLYLLTDSNDGRILRVAPAAP